MSAFCSWSPINGEQYRYRMWFTLSFLQISHFLLSTSQILTYATFISHLHLAEFPLISFTLVCCSFCYISLLQSLHPSTVLFALSPISIASASLSVHLSPLSFSPLIPVECNNVNVICSASIKHTLTSLAVCGYVAEPVQLFLALLFLMVIVTVLSLKSFFLCCSMQQFEHQCCCAELQSPGGLWCP